MFDRRQKINLAAALVCAAMFGYAIFAEKVYHYVPCPLCMFQRVCIVALGIVFLIAALHPARRTGCCSRSTAPASPRPRCRRSCTGSFRARR